MKMWHVIPAIVFIVLAIAIGLRQANSWRIVWSSASTEPVPDKFYYALFAPANSIAATFNDQADVNIGIDRVIVASQQELRNNRIAVVYNGQLYYAKSDQFLRTTDQATIDRQVKATFEEYREPGVISPWASINVRTIHAKNQIVLSLSNWDTTNTYTYEVIDTEYRPVVWKQRSTDSQFEMIAITLIVSLVAAIGLVVLLVYRRIRRAVRSRDDL